MNAYYAIGAPVKFSHVNQLYCQGENNSRVVALPGKEDTIRGYSGVNLLIIDEASRVADDLYRACRPMVAISGGRIALLSTPFGQRGFFYREWIGQGNWKRIKAPATQCARLTKEFLRDELRTMGETYFAQEYLNSFTAVAGLVYPNFERCRVDEWPNPEGRKVGGIDWGWRNPFAAVWGVHEPKTDILWINAERYLRNETLRAHLEALKPLNTAWMADPAGPVEIMEFRAADMKVWRGDNDIKAGIAAVNARIETGRLKVYWPRCPNMVEESQIYRYPDKKEFCPEPEKPIDDFNHALSALRYLVSKLDAHFMARYRKDPSAAVRQAYKPPVEQKLVPNKEQPPTTVDINNPDIWRGF